MQDQLAQFTTKKNLASLLVLAILVLAIPIGVDLVRQQQDLRSKAAGEQITFASPNVEARTGPNGPVTVALDQTIGMKLGLPNGWSYGTTTSSSPLPSVSPSIPPSTGGSTCSITGDQSTLTSGGSMNLSVAYNREGDSSKNWDNNDKMHNEIDWFEINPSTGAFRFTKTSGTCTPSADALGTFGLQCDSHRGNESNNRPQNQNVTFNASKKGTTVIVAHPFLWYSGGSCTDCQAKADNSHAYCSTNLLTVQ